MSSFSSPICCAVENLGSRAGLVGFFFDPGCRAEFLGACRRRPRLVGVDRRVLGLLLPLDGHLPLRVLALDTRFGLAPLPLQPRVTDLGRLLGNETLLFSCQLTFPSIDLRAGSFLFSL